MKIFRLGALFVLTLCGCGSSAADPTTVAPTVTESESVELSSSNGRLEEQLATHAIEARRRGLKPVLYAHAAWCPPCNAIQQYAADPAMRDAFVGTYVIGVDIDDWGDELGRHEIGGIIPIWVGLDEHNRPGSQRITGGAWDADVPANMAGPLRTFFRSL